MNLVMQLSQGRVNVVGCAGVWLIRNFLLLLHSQGQWRAALPIMVRDRFLRALMFVGVLVLIWRGMMGRLDLMYGGAVVGPLSF